MSTENRRYAISSGPSKFELMVADYDNSSDHPRFVTFGITGTVEIREDGVSVGDLGQQPCNVMINGTEREDGSGERRMFSGYTTKGGCFRENIRVKGYFDTKRRTGWIEFVSNADKKWWETHRPKSG